MGLALFLGLSFGPIEHDNINNYIPKNDVQQFSIWRAMDRLFVWRKSKRQTPSIPYRPEIWESRNTSSASLSFALVLSSSERWLLHTKICAAHFF